MRRFVLLLLAIVPLSGCGGVDGSLFATAVHNTQAAGGAEIAFQWNYDIPGRDQPVVMLGSGVESADGQTAQVGQADGPPLLVGQLEVGGCLALLDHFSSRDSLRSLSTRPPVCSSGQ